METNKSGYWRHFCLIACMMLFFGMTATAQRRHKTQPDFEHKKGVLEWVVAEIGRVDIDNISVFDTATVNVNGLELFVVCFNYTSGVSRIEFYVFVKQAGKSYWRFSCKRDTNTRKVRVELDDENKQVVFKSISGKTVLILPYDSLAMDFDWSEQ